MLQIRFSRKSKARKIRQAKFSKQANSGNSLGRNFLRRKTMGRFTRHSLSGREKRGKFAFWHETTRAFAEHRVLDNPRGQYGQIWDALSAEKSAKISVSGIFWKITNEISRISPAQNFSAREILASEFQETERGIFCGEKQWDVLLNIRWANAKNGPNSRFGMKLHELLPNIASWTILGGNTAKFEMPCPQKKVPKFQSAEFSEKSRTKFPEFLLRKIFLREKF